MNRRQSRRYFVLLLILYETAATVDITVNDPQSSFFLKPEEGSNNIPFSQQKEFLIAPLLSRMASVRAAFGEYSAEQAVAQSMLKKVQSLSQFSTNAFVRDHEISAHMVRQSISPDRPLVQVLFHANVISPTVVNNDQKNNNPEISLTHEIYSNHNQNETKICLTAYALKDFHQISSFCILNERTKVCLAEIRIPDWWWTWDEIINVDVFYVVGIYDRYVNCVEAFNQTENDEFERNFLSSVSLTNSPLTYEELKEDSNILIYIPQASFYPGSTFRVPVKLHSDSSLETFIMKVKARHGVRVVGAEAKNSSSWKITLDLNHKLHGAMVTASNAGRKPYSNALVDVFEWIFEVEEVVGEDRGRINLLLEYEKNGANEKELYQPVENRIVTRVEIQRDNVFAIVPVVKIRELINLAILTGKTQSYQIRIYSVTHSGRVLDVTSQSTCHSGDENVLKVVESCNIIFLDGTELHGSASVNIITKFGRHTKFLYFQVWMPEFPLDVTVSDADLGMIKGWKVPQETQKTNRKIRDTDYVGLINAGLLNQEKLMSRKEVVTCDNHYQSSVVNVYASFILMSTTNKQYLINQATKFQMTDFIQNQMRIVDPTVLALTGNVIRGLKPGKTEIQIISNSGKVIGSREVSVSNEKVSIDRLQVDVISGLSLTVDANVALPGTLIVRLAFDNQLKWKDQEAELDTSVVFDDKSILSLRYFHSNDYLLDFESLDSDIIEFNPEFSPNNPPRVIAHSPGKGELLKIILELSDVCQRKASRPLAVGLAYVDVDFLKTSTESKEILNDAEQFKYGGTKKSNLSNTGQTLIPKQIAHVNYDGNESNLEGPGDRDSKKEEIEDGSQKDVHQKHMKHRQRMSSLEIGMYVLLGIFCFAVIIFGINCSIFFIRYRRKKTPGGEYKDTVNCAPDWLWISRDMLESNDINTSCSQALMPDADFNGNQSPPGATGSSGTISERNTCTSNRNSFISTYKGSECSIQIATNPNTMPDFDEMRETRHNNSSTPQVVSDGTPCRPTPQQIRQYMEEMEMSTESLKGNTKPTHEERLRHIEEGAASGSDFEWDYEVLGVTYEQLMEYFDNLKESTA